MIAHSYGCWTLTVAVIFIVLCNFSHLDPFNLALVLKGKEFGIVWGTRTNSENMAWSGHEFRTP